MASWARIFVWSAEPKLAELEIAMKQGKAQVARAGLKVELIAGANELKTDFQISAPCLWSPEEPNLYELDVRLKNDRGEDRWSTRTGIGGP